MSGRKPLQAELHRHIDVSIRIRTLHELAQARGLIPQSTSLDAFRSQVILSRPLSSLQEVLGTFALFQKVLDRPEAIERISYEGIRDCYNEGTRLAELRFSPSFVARYSGLSWKDVLSAFESGAERALRELPDMRAGFICIATREYGPEATAETAEFFLTHSKRFIGFDLAGNEAGYPCKLFAAAFRPIREAGHKITVHAGEDSGPENIWQAIEDLGAHRIGHGIRCVEDPKLMQVLAEKRICLEICPTSNWLTGVVPSLVQHPLPQIVRAGIPVSINTDDPGVFGCTLPHELELVHEIIGLSDLEVEGCLQSAEEASFLKKV